LCLRVWCWKHLGVLGLEEWSEVMVMPSFCSFDEAVIIVLLVILVSQPIIITVMVRNFKKINKNIVIKIRMKIHFNSSQIFYAIVHLRKKKKINIMYFYSCDWFVFV
jgi:hypothetical protein